MVDDTVTAASPQGVRKVFSGEVDGEVPSSPSGNRTSQASANSTAPASAARCVGGRSANGSPANAACSRT